MTPANGITRLGADMDAPRQLQQFFALTKPRVVLLSVFTAVIGMLLTARIRIVPPHDANGTLPVLFHFHGRGWILINKNTHGRLTRELAVGANAPVVFVHYDRPPRRLAELP